jgi:hypothetical protein
LPFPLPLLAFPLVLWSEPDGLREADLGADRERDREGVLPADIDLLLLLLRDARERDLQTKPVCQIQDHKQNKLIRS